MYLISLTTQESEILADYVRSCPLETVRLRAHALLMRNKRLEIDDISALVFRSQRTVTRWFEEFSEKRLASIFSGQVDNENASKLTRIQKLEIKKVLGTPPDERGIPKEFWDVPKLKDYIQAEFGVRYESDISYHFLLRFSGLSFKYPEKTSPRRDEDFILVRIKEIRQEIKPLLTDPHWIVLASDETRIQLEAEIRKAWLIKGKKTKIKTEKSKEYQNYIGFLDQKIGKCQIFKIKKGKQIYIIPVLRKLVKNYPRKRVCVVWDNAKFHKGKLLRIALSKGQGLEKLHLISFPPYAPEFNPVEHVWQFAKSKIANRDKGDFNGIKESFENTINFGNFNYKI